MPNQDAIGARGEHIATALLLKFWGRDEPYFRPHLLGDKFPTFDLFVSLTGVPRPTYFLAQVKATAKETVRRASRLRVEVAAADVVRPGARSRRT